MDIPTIVLSSPSIIEKDYFSYKQSDQASIESVDIFYDSHSTIQEDYETIRRPSIQKPFSSALTNKSISIPIKSKYDISSESIVLVAQQRKWSTHHTKRPLEWKEYRATITKSGYLKLYPICQCHNYYHLLHMCFHHLNPYYNKASFKIDLKQESRQWRLFRRRQPPCSLSLVSAVDFTWSLESKREIFYFQTRHIQRSQAWYRAIYQALPSSSKRALPRSIDLNIPELSITIQLPLCDSLAEANVDLKGIRDSALALLHQYNYRPSDWNRQTVGVCWHYQPLDSLHWEVIPFADHNTTYLVGPQLIENTHTLELRRWVKPTPTPSYPFLEGYLIQHDKRMMYAKSIDNYLFLYKIKVPKKRYPFRKKRTIPSEYTHQPDTVIGVIDLSKVKHDTKIHFNQQSYTFQSLYHSLYSPSPSDTILKSDTLYVKSKLDRFHTFQQRLCFFTSSGEMYMFNKKNKLECHLSLKRQHCFIYSGEACCAYIKSLPNELPCRMFDSGTVAEQEEPSRCCFVVLYKKKLYLFLARTRLQKEEWVESIYSTIQL